MLASDPSVEKMTRTQWLMEFHALRDREAALADVIGTVYKNSITGIRDLLITLLGLKFQHNTEDQDPEAFPEFTPLSLVVGRPEVLKALIDKEESDAAAKVATDDEAFDAWSQKLAEGDYSDMDPVIMETATKAADPNTAWYSESTQRKLRALGVQQTEPDEEDTHG